MEPNLRRKEKEKEFFEAYLLRTATPAEREGEPKKISVQGASILALMMILQGIDVGLRFGRLGFA